MKRTVLLAVTFGILSLGSVATPAEDGEEAKPTQLAPFRHEVEQLVKKYYPLATVTGTYDEKSDVETLHFEFSTYPIVTRYRAKDGSWEQPIAVRGPYVGGVWCDMKFQKGRYAGDVPGAEKGVTEQGPDYYSRVFAPYSKKLDRSLTVMTRFPGGTPPKFLDDFDGLVKNFETCLVKPTETQNPENQEP